MRDVILERGGTGEDYPTIVVAAQRAAYDTAPAKRGWTLNKGALRYLLGPGRETTFVFDTLRTAALRESPADLLAEPKAPDEMRYAELGRYVDALSRSGSDTKKLRVERDRKSTRLNSSHDQISYAVFCLKKKKNSTDEKVLLHAKF